MKDPIRVALAGNPNCGKTTLFNKITGLNQKTGNFPGVTVERKSGKVKLRSQEDKGFLSVDLIDLPGLYSLYPQSLDEQIAHKVLCNKNDKDRPDIVLSVIDANSILRGLYLASQIIDLGLPQIIVLNANGKENYGPKATLLAEELGVEVVVVNAQSGKGVADLKRVLLKGADAPKIDLIGRTEQLKQLLGEKSSVYQEVHHQLSEQDYNYNERIKKIKTIESIERNRIVKSISNRLSVERSFAQRFSLGLDDVLLHKFWGYVVFLFVLFLIFQSVFWIASYPMDWIDGAYGAFTSFVSESLGDSMLSSLFVDGVLAGIGGVIIFIPQIAILFGLISLLEETGYMARVSFIMDRHLKGFGLNGKSIIPMVSSVACAVPAIMGARTISNRKERLITIMVAPLMSCSARLPVYTLLIALVIPKGSFAGIIGYQGLTLMLLYLIGFLAAILAALVFKRVIKSKERSFFVMELPEYKFPKVTNVLFTMYEKVKVFLLNAGKIIVAISIILWALASFGPGNSFQEIDSKYAGKQLTGEVQNKIAAEKLENSYAGHLGKFMEPAIEPLGFDWKIGIALVTSFAAREVFVGTISTIYSLGSETEEMSIVERLRSERDPETGKLKYTFALGISIMLFYAFAMQCMSTLAVVFKETGSWKWPVIQLIYMSALAYLSSLAAYQILS